MRFIKSANQKIRQNWVFLHTSRLTLENLWKALDMRMMTLTFASTKRGKFVLPMALVVTLLA
ncbi:hypothetical protein VV7356_10715 [Vibrio vulnificus]|nr:hypothetical protein Y702_05860 [Vibrio vulnificus BAA87]